MREIYYCHYEILDYRSKGYRVLTCCINVTYIIGHKRDKSLASLYRAYSVSIDHILMLICEV
jgi:hypothetical protein